MKELEYKIKNAKQLKEKEMKAAEAEVKNCKKDVDAAKKQWGAKEAEEAALTMEIAELKKAIDEGKKYTLTFLFYMGHGYGCRWVVFTNKDSVY